jgi:cellulose synthase/poly-beta-1,6-N-acetylglucosamine synthase-like glycosyltransferase
VVSRQGLYFVFFIPALNEEAVIAQTISNLLRIAGDFLILVIDDASDDGTAEAVLPFCRDDRVRLLREPKDTGRRGKGAALNACFAEVTRLQLANRYGPDNVIVAVFDSDARADPSFLATVSSYFHDPAVGGVQCAVRMYNARHNLLSLWQHIEFAIWGTVFCRAKNFLGTATLGGNGQCVRLSALASLDSGPWQPSSLTEDLDLSLRLLLKGWQMRFCSTTAVEQEAVVRLRRLVRQRGRWMQGHFVCWQYLPALLRAPLPLYARLDLVVYLVMPAVFLPIGVVSFASWIRLGLGAGGITLPALFIWYLLGFGIAPLATAAYYRTEQTTFLRSVWHAHLFTGYSIVWFLAAIVAVKNVFLGRRAWTKTSRLIPTSTQIKESQSGVPAD